MCQEPGVTSAAMRVDVCYKASKCVRQISKRTQADRASVGANQRRLNELTSWDGRGLMKWMAWFQTDQRFGRTELFRGRAGLV